MKLMGLLRFYMLPRMLGRMKEGRKGGRKEGRKEGRKDSFDRSVAQSKGRVDPNRRSKRFERLTCIRSGDNKVVFLRRCLMVALRICSLALGLLRAGGGGEVLYMPLALDRTQVVRQSNVCRSREGNGSHWSSDRMIDFD